MSVCKPAELSFAGYSSANNENLFPSQAFIVFIVCKAADAHPFETRGSNCHSQSLQTSQRGARGGFESSPTLSIRSLFSPHEVLRIRKVDCLLCLFMNQILCFFLKHVYLFPSERNVTAVLDIAHNVDAIKTFTRKLQRTYPTRRFRVVFGMCSDKDVANCLPYILALAPLHRIHCVSVRSL